MKQAVIGIGTNIGDREKNLKKALESLSLLPRTSIKKISKVYETKPWGYEKQQNFYNCCVLISTSLSPKALLGALLGIEAALGRIRLFKNGPRVIDLDLLLYEDYTRNEDELTVPHPRINERAFVLCPLKDLFEDETFYGFDFSQALEQADKNSIINIIELKFPL